MIKAKILGIRDNGQPARPSPYKPHPWAMAPSWSQPPAKPPDPPP